MCFNEKVPSSLEAVKAAYTVKGFCEQHKSTQLCSTNCPFYSEDYRWGQNSTCLFRNDLLPEEWEVEASYNEARFKKGDRVVFVQVKSDATDTPPLYSHGTIKRISTYTFRGYQAYEVLWDNKDDDDGVYIMCDDELDFEEAFNKAVIKSFQQEVNKRLDKEDVSSHYKGDVEPIELMTAQFSPEAYMGFVRGNIIKYATRFGKKDTKLHEAKKIYEYAKYLLNYVRYLEEKQEEEK